MQVPSVRFGKLANEAHPFRQDSYSHRKQEEGERGKPHKNNDSVGIVLGSEGSEGSEGTVQEGQQAQEGQEGHDVVNGTAKEKETKKRTRTSGTTFGSISFIDRPVDDLIPLGAFCVPLK